MYHYKRLIVGTIMAVLVMTGCTSSLGMPRETADASNADHSEGQQENSVQENVNAQDKKAQEEISSGINVEELFSDRDKRTDYSDAVHVNLKDGGTVCASPLVSVEGDRITITGDGTFLLSGSLSDGQIIVDAGDDAKIQIVLNGVDIQCSDSAALYVKKADKVFVTLADGMQNELSNKEGFATLDDNHVDGVIFSKDDLTFNGSGSLKIQAADGHGIVCKDELVFVDGSYEVSSKRHALSGKESVCVAGGSFQLTSGGDGIHADYEEDETLGFIYINGGSFHIESGGDGMDASGALEIADGQITIQAGGGYENGEQKSGGWGTNRGVEITETDTVSTKGLKASKNLLIHGGNFEIDTADDALHSNADMLIENSTFSVYTGDDGLHADNRMAVQGGKITVYESYEGMEGQSIDISGGTIALKSSDDGLNAAGGNDSSGIGGRQDMFAADENAKIMIAGGEISINASGDGIDSNGDLLVTGGTIYVSGSTNSGNGALDYNGSAQITGGVVMAAGAGGMAEGFGDTSTQGSMLVAVSESQTQQIVLKDKNGKELLCFAPEKAYNSVVVSSPDIKQGETYELTLGEETVSVEMTEITYGSSFGMGGHGGMGGRKHGGIDSDMPHGQDGKERMEPPKNTIM